MARKDALADATATRRAMEGHLRKVGGRGSHLPTKTGVRRGEPISIEEPITVRSLSAALGVKSNDIMRKLMAKGVFATINQSLDRETAETVALEFGADLQVAQQATLEEELLLEFDAREVSEESLRPRPAVVTI